jgi:hypothetical protein
MMGIASKSNSSSLNISPADAISSLVAGEMNALFDLAQVRALGARGRGNAYN